MMKKELYRLMLELTNNRVYTKFLKGFTRMKYSKVLIPSFAKVFEINQDELERNYSQYKSLNDFFSRELKEGSRVLPSDCQQVVSPVDGMISEAGHISDKLTFHVKGKAYSLKTMLGLNGAIDRYTNGQYCVFYLSPKDYHRIHSPFQGNITRRWALGTYSEPVNQMGAKFGHEPLATNFRLITELVNRDKRIAIVKVGALNVNSIHPSHSGTVLERGEEMAYFSFGSTVILLFEPNSVTINEEMMKGDVPIKQGQSIGRWKEEG